MSQTQMQPNTQQSQTSVKKKYKLEGMIASVIIMWLDYIFIYNGLISGDTAIMSSGMVIMLFGAAVAYYFG